MSQPIDKEVVQGWLDRLTRRDVDAVHEISRQALRVRGAVRTRGGPTVVAPREVPSSLEQQLKRLTTSADEHLRSEVAFALGGLGGAASVPPLCHLALRDEVAGVRAQAVGALGRIGGPKAVETLRQVALQDQDESVRADAVDELGLLMRRAEDKALKASLGAFLSGVAAKDHSPYVRDRAARMSRT